MKKKLTLSILIILIFTLTIVSSLFLITINNQYIESSKNRLKNNNSFILKVIRNEDPKNIVNFIKNNYRDNDIRVTLLDHKGNVLVDSKENRVELENHNKREEIVNAKKNGEAYSVRYSNTRKVESLYFASKVNNDYIIRSAIDMKDIKLLEKKYSKYYISIILFSFVLSFLFSSRISMAMIKPIKNLEFVTSRIARGDFDRRVIINSEDEIGRLGRTFNAMADILENSLVEVRDKQNRLEAILKSMDSGVVAIDKEFKVIMINPYANKLFGIKRDIIGENLMDNIRDFELEKVLRDKEPGYKEIGILWPEKRTLRVKTTDIISKYDNIGTVAVVQDITDIKKLENMREQFVANVSHELKTPLTSIKGFSETLKYVDDKKNREKFLQIINDEADRLTRLINDILVLSNIEKQKQELIKEKIDLNELIEKVYCLVKKSAEDKNIKINIVGEKVPLLIGNKDKYNQMIINLVDNAIKYTEPNGYVSIGTRQDKGNIVFWVEDTGVGISEEHLDRIFERFYRVDKARSRVEGGTGLGLAIVKHIVLSINGKIEVKSEPKKGTKFIVKIPLSII
ncbi:PAS domain-containing sensor histidine kinase [Clostridium botulinum]|uniref:histidine kinase n=1 Tax=Clostridium botulinum (strain Hall / ATCC 3502 / NCTC 13319 / Type A) TaxID=441771 RepID=A5I4V7_CLOBH|nr:ATP-binding protein [Clostridium botulinum]ABS34717.1 sensor histidine kinase [Clostridium botulinum A str. ATCC 19397]ABS37820.1 sensor histidine kinase [Clostridium botulinum A str. Hall]AUN10468.1 PAS domain-containing sensor histidine kinase [Clostridium botulinum]AUN22423.1 PAS domain-containing sensor histidine kinase [Clostridium botulinum]AUN26134.1 PAS domain-containing sensor histidine kinase [Clostridium botulinum]